MLMDQIVDQMDRNEGNEGMGKLNMLNRVVVDNQMFRGLGADITGMQDVREIAKKAGLYWKVVTVPAAKMVKGNWVEEPGYRFQLRGRNHGLPEGVADPDAGRAFVCSSDKYKPFQNDEVLTQMIEAAKIGDLRMRMAGALGGGARIFAVADTVGTGKEFAITPKTDYERGIASGYNAHAGVTMSPDGVRGDVTRLQVIMSNRHDGTGALVISAVAMREWCANTVTLTAAAGRISIRHTRHLTQQDHKRIQELFRSAIEEFETYESKARRMYETPMTRLEQEALVLELLQPELILEAACKLPISNARPQQPLAAGDVREAGRRVLAEVAERDVRLWSPDLLTRPTNRIIECMDTQPGAASGRGTAWQTFNAVTYYADHVRGRSADSGAEAAYFGEGDRLKTRALELIVDHVDSRR